MTSAHSPSAPKSPAATSPAPKSPAPTTEAPSPGTPTRRQGLLLLLFLALCLLCRIWLATPNPTKTRFWDERYSVENAAAVAWSGDPRPKNGFHPSLSYLPQAGALAAQQSLARRWPAIPTTLESHRELTAAGTLQSRYLVALFGVLSLWSLARIGRRLGGPGMGLLAAFLLAVTPWHLRQSAIFKPDMLLIWLTLVAFEAGWWAARRGGWRRYALAGLAVGACMAAKYNGGPIALPLAAATLAGLPRFGTKALGWLALAGVVAAATFALLNPFLLLSPDLFLDDFGRTLEDYERKTVEAESSGWAMPVHAVETLLARPVHGLLIGALALVGLAGIAVRLAAPFGRRLAGRFRGANGEAGGVAISSGAPPLPEATRLLGGGTPEQRLGWMMVLVFLVAYVLLYALTTGNPSPHNWLTLAPFTSLAAAAVLTTAWRGLDGASRAGRAVGGVASVALLVTAALPGTSFLVEKTVPTTVHRAEDLLRERLMPLGGRTILSEVPLHRRLSGFATQARTQTPTKDQIFLEIRSDGSFGADERAAADAVVLRADGMPADAAPDLRIRPRLFHSRGEELAVFLRPFPAPRVGPWRPLRAPGGRAVAVPMEAAWPELEGAGWMSLEAGFRRGPNDDETPPAVPIRIEVGAGEGGTVTVPCVRIRRTPRRIRCLSPRFRMSSDLVLRPEARTPGLAIRIRSWDVRNDD